MLPTDDTGGAGVTYRRYLPTLPTLRWNCGAIGCNNFASWILWQPKVYVRWSFVSRRQPTVSTVLVVAWHWRSSSLLRRPSVDKHKTILRNQIISVTARSNNSHRTTTSSRDECFQHSLSSFTLFFLLSYSIRHAAQPAAANHSFLGQVSHACRYATAKCVTHGRRYPCASQIWCCRHRTESLMWA